MCSTSTKHPSLPQPTSCSVLQPNTLLCLNPRHVQYFNQTPFFAVSRVLSGILMKIKCARPPPLGRGFPGLFTQTSGNLRPARRSLDVSGHHAVPVQSYEIAVLPRWSVVVAAAATAAAANIAAPMALPVVATMPVGARVQPEGGVSRAVALLQGTVVHGPRGVETPGLLLGAAQHGTYPPPNLLAEQAVDQRVHAAVGGSQPLGERVDVQADEDVSLAGLEELVLQPDDVEGHPGDHEQQDHHHQHLHHLHLGLLDDAFAGRDARRVPVPHAVADHEVEEGDEDHGQAVEDQEDDPEKEALAAGSGGELLGAVVERPAFVDVNLLFVEQRPGQDDQEGDNPDDQKNHPGSALGVTLAHHVTDGDVSKNRNKKLTLQKVYKHNFQI
ncbi:hypothetical protein Btru_029765 [Bulinus truncatus]|nr:hypothetical protein Btru_029765 [Bulinus truncatus]